MWPGGELPVYRPGQQETMVWWGGRDSKPSGGRPVLEIYVSRHWDWGKELA